MATPPTDPPSPCSINLWCLLTRSAKRESAYAIDEQAHKIVELASKAPSFGSELSLTVAPTGTWDLRVFSHDDDNSNEIIIRILPDGDIVITRELARNDISDHRTISF